MRITQEQIDRANAVNLPQFLIKHGFELKRMSHDEFIWKRHESLFIHDNQNGESGKWFRFSENHGGDNIDFVREYMDLSFRQAVEPPAELPEWVHLGETENGLPINKYFEQNLDMVLGEVVEGNKLYGKSGTMVIPTEGADLKEQLQTAVSKLSATISDERARDVYAKTEHGEVKIPSNLRNYSFFEHENHIYFKTSDRVCSFRFDRTNSHHRHAKAFIELRDTTRELLTAQELDKPDSEIKELQAKLNRIYDNFYKNMDCSITEPTENYSRKMFLTILSALWKKRLIKIN